MEMTHSYTEMSLSDLASSRPRFASTLRRFTSGLRRLAWSCQLAQTDRRFQTFDGTHLSKDLALKYPRNRDVSSGVIVVSLAESRPAHGVIAIW
ncbi:MAG: hypothetical protein AUI45_12265 [Acidobacteria bacterium 13_1_40CM_2_56_11]|nr:MAG: hypothetical protein AUI45_12265 [Acidobacteria bacterium 13_1_40CM_2_56_11]